MIDLTINNLANLLAASRIEPSVMVTMPSKCVLVSFPSVEMTKRFLGSCHTTYEAACAGKAVHVIPGMWKAQLVAETTLLVYEVEVRR